MQFALVFVALMASCILISILVSNLLLKTYYRNRQMGNLEEIFDRIDDRLGSRTFISEGTIKEELDRMSANYNFDICLLDAMGKLAVYSSDGNNKKLVDSLSSYIFTGEDSNAKNSDLVKEENGVRIFRTEDEYYDTVNYDLVGKLNNGIYCLVRMNYASVERAAKVANNFYAYVGIFIILIEAIVIIIFLRRFTKPILVMNEVAKKMADLDFEAKAEVNSANEIGQLAKSLNILSESLERNILDLKKANSELQVDLEKREKLDEMRRDFLGNVSHELKTPIAIIQGYAEGLKEGVNDDPESRDFYCDVIMDEAVKMNTLVKKILSLNKLEYGEDQLEISRFDITKMISGVLAASEVLAEDREIKVEFDSSLAHFVYADEYMTEEVITNYISNAYHYVAGENIIKVSLKETGNALRFAVYNSGSHIDDENIPKVWEKFFKVDKARTREYGGSGIGLSIVKAIMELHHRDCGVRNIDDGVEFWADFDCMADSRISDKEVKENDSDN